MLRPDSQSPRTSESRRLPNVKAKEEITPEKFARFLEWLSPDNARAGEEYERLCFRLSTFFSQRRCVYADELVDETINRVILKSSQEQIESKIAYCYGVAKNVYRESLRRAHRCLDIDEIQLIAPTPAEPGFSRECLDQCLEQLPSNKRNLLLDYFSEEKSAKITFTSKSPQA
jgi:DNA-directed RNA polymerase specialized sigma24 family protein